MAETADQENSAAEGEATQQSNAIARFFRLLGPGLITGAADDDPGGIATYAQVGAQYGYSMLWTGPLTFLMMIVSQYISAKIGLVKNKGLASVIDDAFPRPVLYVSVAALLIANVINAGVDIGAIAAAINLFVPVPIPVLVVPITVLILVFLTFGSFGLIQTTFKWLAVALFAYIASSFLGRPDWPAALKGTFVPTIQFTPAFLSLVVAALGTNVSPYLFFWQAEEEATAERVAGIHHIRGGELRRAALDTIIGMLFSDVAIYFVAIATAATLFRTGHHNITSAVQAASALKPIAGSVATVLWAVGIIGVGMLGVPTLTASAADAVSVIFAWRHGLDQRLRRAWHFYAVLAVAMLLGMAINFTGINPIRALVLSAVINGVLTPPLLALIMLVSGKEEIMGEHRNGLLLNVAGWGTAAIMAAAAVGMFATMF